MITYQNLKGQIINGLLVGERTCLRPLKWETECVRCGSKKIFEHAKLMQAATGALNAAHCALDNCYLLHSVRRPVPPTERPKREQEPVALPVPVVSKPTPAPAPPDPLQGEYNRYVEASREWGNTFSFETFKQAKHHKPDFYNNLMRSVEEQEEKDKGEAFAEQLEKENFERIMEYGTFGKEMCSNGRGE